MIDAFKPFMGEWNVTGSHGEAPGIALHGTSSFRLENNFVVMRVNIVEDVGIPTTTAVFGIDDEFKQIIMSHYDTRGIYRMYNIDITGNVLKWGRMGSLIQRNVITANGDTMSGRGIILKEDKGWTKDLSLDYVRA